VAVEKAVPAGGRVSHAARKLRTRTALLTSCRQLIQSGADVTMPVAAAMAGVSEATAYRHFPDLVSLVNEALTELWPSPATALAPVETSADPVERIGFACEFLLRRVLAYQGSVRAVIAATITRPALAPARPGFRFGLIDEALDPVLRPPDTASAARAAQLKQDLAAILSAEALFSLTDLCGLSADNAIGSLRRTAQTITRAALAEMTAARPAAGPPRS
jgi:AcrR family transcriptional regulator